ncbi:SRPBCC domain-containing protein [Micromonospora profundi]|uniref:SRPBCC domain-containing protein n=1 Tax=Micromonospora profundi TaxID=1420889 RepID=UPI00368BFB48
MKITNEFTVAVPIDRAWAVLTDLAGIAPCLPGAQLTGVDGEVYRGKVKVKVGPVISEFAGTAQFVEKDSAAYRGVIDAKGRDARSTGNASALVTARLRPDGDRTLVSVDTDLKISGKLAQFGSGMIKEVSGKLLAQFVANLEAKLAAEQTTPTAVAAPAAADEPTVSAPQTVSAPPTVAEVRGAGGDAAAVPAARSGDDPAAPAPIAPEAPELSPAASATAVDTTPATAAVAPSPIDPSPIAPSPIEPTAITASPITEAPAEPSPLADPSAGEPSPADPSTDERAVMGHPTPGPAQGRPSAVDGRTAPAAEPEALDLLSLAGGSITKRLVPAVVGLVAVGAVIAWLVARR